jgi:hypothetical protein
MHQKLIVTISNFSYIIGFSEFTLINYIRFFNFIKYKLI